MFAIPYVVALISVCEFSNGARILGIVPTPSYSHQIVFRPIWNELARRGHDVVVITTDPENDPHLNITEIDISVAYEVWRNRSVIKLMNDFKYNIIKLHEAILDVLTDIITQEVLHPGVQQLLKNESEHFDLAIIEYLFPPILGFSERFKCPYIGVVSLELPNWFHSILGNPVHPVLYPDGVQLGFAGKLNFWERLASVGFTIVGEFLNTFRGGFETIPAITRLMEEQFGKDINLDRIMKNVSMMLINDNPAFSVRPMGPGFILFGGGAHLTPLKPLPEDLKEYLDGAKNGFIYFSLGTNVKSDVFTPESRKVLLDAFRELSDYRVLWKFDVTDIPDVPDNVKIVNWLPQQDILRHPKIKVFITQGGLQSTEEAIFSHVPIVGIPFVADQMGNVKKVVAKGGGIFLDKDSLTKESVKEALLEVINNPKYKESITEIAELSNDQPMTGIEKAIWWTEYVLRHKGARHFRNPAIDLPLYQYYLLDVIGFSLAVTSIFLFIIYKLIVLIKNLVLRIFISNSKKIKSQ